MNKKLLLVFLVTFFLAAFLRLYRINEIPPGVNRDEASIGYTAYSLLQTGSDEYGRHLPISFQSFGDWKLPLYIYTVVPFVKIFGLSELAVRLPSAIFGIASVFLTFFLMQLLLNNKFLSFFTMLLMAISPWSIHLSRVESESNTAVFFTIIGTIFFLKSLQKRNWYIVLSALFFALTYFTYAGNHVFTTLLVLGLLVIYFRLISKTKTTAFAVFVFLFLSGFIFYHTLTQADKTKLSGIGIFGDPSVVLAKIILPKYEHQNPQSLFESLFAKIVHNKVEFAAERFVQNYLNSFSPDFLFIKGGLNKAHNINNFGNMYLVEAPFFFLGVLYLLFKKRSQEENLVLWWLLISPLTASITKDAPHTNRMFAVFPILPLLTALGIFWLVSKIKKKFTSLLFIAIAFVFLFNFALYIDRYFVHFPQDEQENWGIGYKRLYQYISSPKFAKDKVVMNKSEWSPYIYFLFYSKFDPRTYQKTAKRYPPTEDGFVNVKSYDRFEFREIDWTKDIYHPNWLLIDTPSNETERLRLKLEYKNRYSEIIVNKLHRMFAILETL